MKTPSRKLSLRDRKVEQEEVVATPKGLTTIRNRSTPVDGGPYPSFPTDRDKRGQQYLDSQASRAVPRPRDKNFRFMAGEQELGRVTKKWAGLGKELFTSADNYVLQISESVPADHVARQLILASVMCIDMVLKE